MEKVSSVLSHVLHAVQGQTLSLFDTFVTTGSWRRLPLDLAWLAQRCHTGTEISKYCQTKLLVLLLLFQCCTCVQVSTGWSYLVCWAGVCLTLVASLATSGSAIALRAQRRSHSAGSLWDLLDLFSKTRLEMILARSWEEDALRMKLRMSSMCSGHAYYPGDNLLPTSSANAVILFTPASSAKAVFLLTPTCQAKCVFQERSVRGPHPCLPTPVTAGTYRQAS